jgi:uncharacterized protein (TIGR02147 family)
MMLPHFRGRESVSGVGNDYIIGVKTNILAPVVRPGPASSFRLLLQSELGRRCASNPHYSLRAFAKYLGLDHATLSQMLRGKRRLTAKMIVKIGTRLGLPEDKLKAYVSYEESTCSAPLPSVNLRAIQQMAHDTAALISEWYHYAILELTRLQDFKPDSRWIARVLGLTPDEVNVAVTRLTRLGLLHMVSRKRWTDTSGDTTTSLADFTQVSIDRLAKQVRGLMLNALQAGDAAACLHNSTTLALQRARLPLVHERIVRFQQELTAFLSDEAAHDDVFQLEISLFPLTNLSQTKETDHGTTSDAVADRSPQSGSGDRVLLQTVRLGSEHQ